MLGRSGSIIEPISGMAQAGLIMKRVIAAAAVAAFGFVGAASAADLPRKAPPIAPAPALYSWSGFYVGGNVGGA